MAEDTFYDLHMHALNLSHPYFRAFIKRFKIDWLMVIVAVISVLALIPGVRRIIFSFINRILRRIRNLLSVMENDIGSFFLITENCIREAENQLLTDNGLVIGGKTYTKFVLTPLMMDFGRKGVEEDSDVHYGKPSEKPIVEQVTDVFNAIKKYKKAVSSASLTRKYPYLTQNTSRIFEIYPFLGLNTKNYDMTQLEKLLKKYFDNYHGSRDDLAANQGKFSGDIDDLKSNYFAGIKVYPPLGFDPWPEEQENLDKVKYLYSYCCDKGIPITAHGSAGGFVAVSNKKDLKKFTSIAKWVTVLKEYPTLKLNLAHFPMQEKIMWIIPDFRHPRLKAILSLLLTRENGNIKYENVYVDFSNRAVSDKYYKSLKKVIDEQSEDDREIMKSRILFGSDYTVNLMTKEIDSYNKYLDIFSKTELLEPEEKHSFCCTNPERFLFG